MSLPSALFSAVALTLRDAANNAAPQDEISNLRGEERGNAARLEPRGHRTRGYQSANWNRFSSPAI